MVIDALKGLAAPDGVISTRPPLLRRAHQLGLTTVQRVFAIDSKSVANLKNLSETGKPDFVEIMPGLIPRVLRVAAELTGIPVIAGGLIEEKSEVIEALTAGRWPCPPPTRACGACSEVKINFYPACQGGKIR